jgi:MurNAc alpha-1-phosphate uridylyltransferase
VVRGRPLIEWHLLALARGGVRDVVINTAWLEEQFPAALGDGSRWGLRLHYSCEGRDHGGALETAGGIAKALPLLGDALLGTSRATSSCRASTSTRQRPQRFEQGDALGHLWLVPNAPHHPQGDFGIDAALAPWPMRPTASPGPASACSRPNVRRASSLPGTRLRLRPLLDRAIAQRRLGAERWPGCRGPTSAPPSDWCALTTGDGPPAPAARVTRRCAPASSGVSRSSTAIAPRFDCSCSTATHR